MVDLTPDALRRLVESLAAAQRTSHRVPRPPQTLRVGFPLSEGQLVIPSTYDFCVTCGLDLLTNPAVLVTDLAPDTVRVLCDCNQTSLLPAWLFR